MTEPPIDCWRNRMAERMSGWAWLIARPEYRDINNRIHNLGIEQLRTEIVRRRMRGEL